jgi:hypothetical protein
MQELGMADIKTAILEMPDQPGYIKAITDSLNERRPAYLKRWGPEVGGLLERLFSDFRHTPPRALPMAFIWGRKR